MKYKYSDEELIEMMCNEDKFENFKKYLESGLSDDEVIRIIELMRSSRINDLLVSLNVDMEKYSKIKNNKIKLNPQSAEWPLSSSLYKNHNGEYELEDLLNEHYDSTFREGIMTGIDYGKKFIIEDIQNKRFTIKDIKEMSKEQIIEYCDEYRENI